MGARPKEIHQSSGSKGSRFTPAANSRAHTSQFGSSGLIIYWSRIRKFVTYRIRKNVTENWQTENREQIIDRETNYKGHSIAVPMERRVERANSTVYCIEVHNTLLIYVVYLRTYTAGGSWTNVPMGRWDLWEGAGSKCLEIQDSKPRLRNKGNGL